MVNTLYLFNFVETPRKFIIAKIDKACNNKFTWRFHKAKHVSHNIDAQEVNH